MSEESLMVMRECLDKTKAELESVRAESLRWQARIKELERRLGVVRDAAEGRDGQ